MGKRETFKAARERLLREALELGWRVMRINPSGRPAVNPWISPPLSADGSEVKAYFKPQAIYFSHGHLTEGRSSWLDMRGLSLVELQSAMARWAVR